MHVDGNVFAANQCFIGSALDITDGGSLTTVSKNRFVGQTQPAAVGSTINFQSIGSISNNEFIGNAVARELQAAPTAPGMVVANNALKGDGTQDGLHAFGTSPYNAVNNILTAFAVAINELAVNSDIVPLSNLFFANATDFRDENATSIFGAANVNTSVAGAAGNVGGSPAFVVGPSGTWSAGGVYQPATFTTLLTLRALREEPGAVSPASASTRTPRRAASSTSSPARPPPSPSSATPRPSPSPAARIASTACASLAPAPAITWGRQRSRESRATTSTATIDPVWTP